MASQDPTSTQSPLAANPASPPKNPRALLRLIGYLKPYRRNIFTGFTCLFIATPVQLFHPLVWMFIIDDVLLSKTREHKLAWLAGALAVMMAVHLLGSALSAARTYLLGIVGQRFVFDLRNRVYAKIQDHSLQFFHDRRSGDLMARAIGDVDALQEVAINGVDQVLSNILQFLFVAGILITLNWKVGLATLLPMIGVAVLVWLFNGTLRVIYRRTRDRLGDVSALLQENLLGVLVIKSFARERHEQQRFEKVAQSYLDASIKGVIVRTFYFPSVMSVGFISNVLMLGIGGYFYLKGSFTLGALVAFRGYWWQLFAPVMSMAQINEMVQRALAAGARVFELLDAPVEITDAADAAELGDTTGRLTCENVTFGYHTRAGIMRGVSLDVPSGQRLGVVGPSGAGKSTLLSLFLRLYDVQDGRVLIDDQDVRQVTQLSLRRQCAVVTQEPFLFNDTIRSNIVYGRLDATDEQVTQAALQANADDFIRQLPQGYETVVGERGVKLSGGQKQRICIARAFLANPRILLLDEATAAVEPESESVIQAALEKLSEGRTAVIVSHRLSMVRDAEQIVVIEHGRISERGSHHELMSLNGWYSRMYRLQMGEEMTGAVG